MTVQDVQKQYGGKRPQIDVIREYLQAGNTLSTWEAYEKWHCTTLAQVIHRLKERGHPIRSELIRKEATHFSVYWWASDDDIEPTADAPATNGGVE